MDKSPKEILNEAYAHLLAGQIDKAASVFQFIIDNRKIYGGEAAHIAERAINWYCVPLEAILNQIEQDELPVDIKAIVSELFHAGTHITEHEIETIVKSLTDQLKKMPDYIQASRYFWTRKKVLEEFALKAVDEIIRAKAPVCLSSLYRNIWSDFCYNHPSFPDHTSEKTLENFLQPFNFKVLSSTLVFTDGLVDSVNEKLVLAINSAGEPLCIQKFIPELFPNITSEQAAVFTKHILLNLTNRITAFTTDYFITTSLMQFDTLSFDTLFDGRYLPCSTIEIVKWRFPELEITQLSPNLQSLIEEQLRNNPHIIRIGEGNWYSQKRLEHYRNQVINTLLTQTEPVSLPELIKPFVPAGFSQKDRYKFLALIAAGLRTDNQAIQVTETHWLHRNQFAGLLEKAYQYLLNAKKGTVKEILHAIFGEKLSSPSKNFYRAFDDYLSKDSRFARNRNNQDEWRVIPVGQRDNDLIFNLLTRVNHPLTDEEIVNKLLLNNPEYDLKVDSRFQTFPYNRWGLSSWILLNDYAYEYLLKNRKALHEQVVVGLVCKEQGLNRRHAFFWPEVDARFAQDSLNRWFCRYQLKDADLDQLLAKLDQYAGAGRRLDILLEETLRLNPDSTNARSVLDNDPRFILLDDLWYSRRVAYRNLSSADIEKIFDYFASLPTGSPAISLKNVGINAFGWDGRLTDASSLLAVDDRFIEIHPGFWGLSSWSTPEFSRSSHGSVAVYDSPPVEEEEPSPIDLPESLTKRKRHKGKEEKPEDILPKFYRTLSHLDVLHGNIRISGVLRKWIPAGTETVVIQDNEGNEVVAYVDETQTILNLRDWILLRNLTYGDKIAIQPGQIQGSLFIRPYGKRDEGIYQEALQHQDIEKLIAEARRVNKTYHDLMIEVMESFGMAMHREDIFQLVDYQRIAARNTIFEILSLVECPYVELRYFVPKGKGFWLFDRNIKRAYDMKMKELLDENSSLKGQVAMLTTRLEHVSATTHRIAILTQKIEELEQENLALKQEKAKLATRIAELEGEMSQRNQTSEGLSRQFEEVRNQLSKLEGRYLDTTEELEALRLEKQQYQEREALLQESQSQIKRMTLELARLEERASQIPGLQAELTQRTLQCERLNLDIGQRNQQLSNLETELAEKSSSLSQLQANLAQAIDRISSQQAALDENQATISRIQLAYSEQSSAHGQELARLNEELRIAKDQLQETKAWYQASMREMDALREANQRLVADLTLAKSSVVELEAEVAESRSTLQSREDERSIHEAELVQRTQALQVRYDSLEAAYGQQTQQLATVTNRLNQIEHALASPIGRFFALIQGLK